LNRRGFLKLLTPAAAILVAPELLIPRKTFFLPPAGGWGHTLTVADLRRFKEMMIRQALLISNPPVAYVNGRICVAQGPMIHVSSANVQPIEMQGMIKRYTGFDLAPPGWPSDWPRA